MRGRRQLEEDEHDEHEPLFGGHSPDSGPGHSFRRTATAASVLFLLTLVVVLSGRTERAHIRPRTTFAESAPLVPTQSTAQHVAIAASADSTGSQTPQCGASPRWPPGGSAGLLPSSVGCESAVGVRAAGLQPQCGCLPEDVTIIGVRAEHTGRFLASFRSGGEVYAIGTPGKMRLSQLALDVVREEPHTGMGIDHTGRSGGGGRHLGTAIDHSGGGRAHRRSVWLSLRHAASNTTLVMLPPDARDGSWTLRLMPHAAAAAAAGAHGVFSWCVEAAEEQGGAARDGSKPAVAAEIPQGAVRLYSADAAGFVNLRDTFLLRGHGDPQRPPVRYASHSHPSERCPVRLSDSSSSFLYSKRRNS